MPFYKNLPLSEFHTTLVQILFVYTLNTQNVHDSITLHSLFNYKSTAPLRITALLLPASAKQFSFKFPQGVPDELCSQEHEVTLNLTFVHQIRRNSLKVFSNCVHENGMYVWGESDLMENSSDCIRNAALNPPIQWFGRDGVFPACGLMSRLIISEASTACVQIKLLKRFRSWRLFVNHESKKRQTHCLWGITNHLSAS